MEYKANYFIKGNIYSKSFVSRLPKDVDMYFEPIINKIKANNKKSVKVEEVEDKDNLKCKKSFQISFIIKDFKETQV